MAGVRVLVVMVSVGCAGGVTDDWLSVHTGVSLICCGVTVQESATALLNPPIVPTVIVERAKPAASTAEGFRGEAVSVKLLCP